MHSPLLGPKGVDWSIAWLLCHIPHTSRQEVALLTPCVLCILHVCRPSTLSGSITGHLNSPHIVLYVNLKCFRWFDFVKFGKRGDYYFSASTRAFAPLTSLQTHTRFVYFAPFWTLKWIVAHLVIHIQIGMYYWNAPVAFNWHWGRDPSSQMY